MIFLFVEQQDKPSEKAEQEQKRRARWNLIVTSRIKPNLPQARNPIKHDGISWSYLSLFLFESLFVGDSKKA